MKEQNRQIYRFDNFQLDAGNRQLRRDDKPLSLPPKAFDLLLALVENKGRLVEKDELFTSVWQDQIVEESNLTVHISQIRKALGETKQNPRYIVTVPGYGYRFVGDIANLEDEELVIETETLSRITIEKEKISDAEILEGGKAEKRESEKLGTDKNEAIRKGRVKKYAAAGAILISLTLAFGFYFLNAKKSVPFEKIKFTRLTNNGKVSAAALSSDGKFIAYALSEADGNSLWVRQVGAANDTRIVPPTKAEFWGLTFTPDGNQIYYNLFFGDKVDPELFSIPTLGGVSKKIPKINIWSITFAPDGKRFAFVASHAEAGQNYLMVADADGANKQVIANKPHPNTFVFAGDNTAWSPDGETIACLVNHLEAETNYYSLVGVNVKDGTEKLLSDKKWREVESLAWMKDGSGLLVSGSGMDSSKIQVWFIPQPSGEARAVTNDLNDYSSINPSANGESFIALQISTINSLSVGAVSGEENTFKEIVSEVGTLSPLIWTPDGKIVFRSAADGVLNLWTINPDGTNHHQLTTDAQADARGMCITPDGKYIVFVSWRSGKSNLWRVDADGSNLTHLTDGEADAHPTCTRDGQAVLYQRGILTPSGLTRCILRY